MSKESARGSEDSDTEDVAPILGVTVSAVKDFLADGPAGEPPEKPIR